MSLQHWPETERPREKLLKLGAASLSEAELLAILLQTGTPGSSALDMARGLLGVFRSLRGLLTAERHALCRVLGSLEAVAGIERSTEAVDSVDLLFGRFGRGRNTDEIIKEIRGIE